MHTKAIAKGIKEAGKWEKYVCNLLLAIMLSGQWVGLNCKEIVELKEGVEFKKRRSLNWVDKTISCEEQMH